MSPHIILCYTSVDDRLSYPSVLTSLFFSQILLAYQLRTVAAVTINYSNRYDGSRDGCNKRADGRAIDQLHRRQADTVLPHIRIHVQVDRRVRSAGRVLRRQVRLSRQVGRTSVLHWYVYTSYAAKTRIVT